MLTTSAVEKLKDHQFSLVLPSIGGVGTNVNLKQSIADYTTPMNPQYALDRRFKWQVGLSELSYRTRCTQFPVLVTPSRY